MNDIDDAPTRTRSTRAWSLLPALLLAALPCAMLGDGAAQAAPTEPAPVMMTTDLSAEMMSAEESPAPLVDDDEATPCANALECSLTCGGGEHVDHFECNNNCTNDPLCTTCQNNNAVCAPNSGSEYHKCGIAQCAPGYHAESFSYQFNCDSCGPGCSKNRTRCVKNHPTQPFDVCGNQCPGGFKQISSGYDPKCDSTCSSGNKVVCKRPVLQAG